MLVTTLESLPVAGEPARAQRDLGKQLIAQLHPSKFLADTPFVKDQLSKWLSRQNGCANR